MKEKPYKEKPACSIKTIPFPTEITCPHCGFEIEIWSDEEKTICKMCGYIVFKHEEMTN